MNKSVHYNLYKQDPSIEGVLHIILQETDNDFVPKISDKYNLDEVIDKFIKLSHCILAFVNNEPAGVVVFYPNKAPNDSYLSIICVRKEYRGLGIGRTLEEKCIQYCKLIKSNGLNVNMRKSNEKLLNSRLSLGYIIERESPSDYGQEVIVNMYMQL